MKPLQRNAELFILLLIIYSLVTYVIELEFAHGIPDGFFLWSERVVAVLFTVEYFVRWWLSGSLRYPARPMAIIDALAILPFYLSFLVDLRALRLLRMLRVARLFKLYRYTGAAQSIANAFHRVRYEFAVVGFAVLTLGLVSSVMVYEFEQEAQPAAFARFSDAIWYTLTTLTTVGYGDKVPITTGGRVVAVLLMIGGLGLFGTFVSLVGSAFLEEIRKTVQPNVNISAEMGSFEMSDGSHAGEFDPRVVLQDIERGVYAPDGGENHDKLIRLLRTACQSLLNS